MKISKLKFFGYGRQKIARLGLTDLFLNVQEIVLETRVTLIESVRANRAGRIKKEINASFFSRKDWVQTKAGAIHRGRRLFDNRNCRPILGVQIQVSARSDLLIRDVVHLRNSLQKAEIDVGVIVVPDDRMQKFLPARTPSFSDAVRYIEVEFKEAMTFPIVVMGIEHDSPGKAIPKKTTNLGSRKP